MVQQFLALSMILWSGEGEEIGLSIDVEHAIKRGSLKATTGAVDGLECCQTVKGDLIWRDTDDWSVFEVESVNCASSPTSPVFVC